MFQTPNLFLTGNVGSGHSRANDVVRIRKALHETGYGRSPQNPSPVYDSSIRGNIVGFQEDFGLKPDGFLAPGGPTELAMRTALEAKRAGGTEAMEAFRTPFAVLAREGFSFMPDPQDRRAGRPRWVDADGNELPDQRRDAILGEARRLGDIKPIRINAFPPHAAEADPLAGLASRVLGKSMIEKTPDAQGQKFAANPGIGRPNTTGDARSSGRDQQGNTDKPTDAKLPGFLDAGSDGPLQQSAEEPHREFLDKLEVRFRNYVKEGRRRGLDHAAANLEHFLGGSGEARVFSREEARKFGPIKAAEDENKRKYKTRTFLAQTDDMDLNEGLKGLKDGDKPVSVKDHWDRVYGPFGSVGNAVTEGLDFYLAFGQTNVRSESDITATRVGDKVHFKGTVTHSWKDKYDFDPMQSFADGALALQKHRRAKPFDFGATWIQRVEATVDIRNGELSNPRVQWSDVNP